MALSAQTSQIIIAIRANNDVGANSNRIEYYVTIQNKDLRIEPEFYGGSAYDETIGARRISNLRGFRVSLSLSYNMSQEKLRKVTSVNGSVTSDQTSTFRDMFNEIMSAFRNGTFDGDRSFQELNIYVLQDGGSWAPIRIGDDGSFIPFVPTEMSYEQTYSNQIGRFRPSISLTAQDLITEIGSGLQGRS